MGIVKGIVRGNTPDDIHLAWRVELCGVVTGCGVYCCCHLAPLPFVVDNGLM